MYHNKDKHDVITLGCSRGTHTLAVTNSSAIGVKTLSTREQACLVLET